MRVGVHADLQKDITRNENHTQITVLVSAMTAQVFFMFWH